MGIAPSVPPWPKKNNQLIYIGYLLFFPVVWAMSKMPKTAINVETEKTAIGGNLRGAVKNRRKTACLTKLTMENQDFRKGGQSVIRALTDPCRCH
jgi:hypothetical protein